MVEHDLGVVFDLADRITVLADGQVIASGPPAPSAATRRCAPPISALPRMRCA